MLGVLFFFRFFLKADFTATLGQFDHQEGDHAEGKQIGRIAHQEDGDVHKAISQAFQCAQEGGLDPLEEAGFLHAGETRVPRISK